MTTSGSESFGPNELNPKSTSDNRAYKLPYAGHYHFFDIYPPYVNGKLSYTRYTCVGGVRTQLTDVPAGNQFNYQNADFAINGYYISRPFTSGDTFYNTFGKSTASFRVDLSTGQVVATLHLIATPSAGGSDMDLGSFTGTGTINAATGRYAGSWSSASGSVQGDFAGTFFGPQGAESGFAFSMIATGLRASNDRLGIDGAVAGTR